MQTSGSSRSSCSSSSRDSSSSYSSSSSSSLLCVFFNELRPLNRSIRIMLQSASMVAACFKTLDYIHDIQDYR